MGVPGLWSVSQLSVFYRSTDDICVLVAQEDRGDSVVQKSDSPRGIRLQQTWHQMLPHGCGCKVCPSGMFLAFFHQMTFFFDSVWFGQCQATFRYNHAQSGAHPELRTIFYRLCHLLQLPVSILFVFDGSGRPSTKRNKQVRSREHWLTNDTRDLLDAFGYSWYTVSCDPLQVSQLPTELLVVVITGPWRSRG